MNRFDLIVLFNLRVKSSDLSRREGLPPVEGLSIVEQLYV